MNNRAARSPLLVRGARRQPRGDRQAQPWGPRFAKQTLGSMPRSGRDGRRPRRLTSAPASTDTVAAAPRAQRGCKDQGSAPQRGRRFACGRFRVLKRRRPRRLTSAPASTDTVAAFRPWRDFRSSVARGRRGHHRHCVNQSRREQLAERGGFEPPKRGLDAYTLSRRAPSTTRTPLRFRALVRDPGAGAPFYGFAGRLGKAGSNCLPVVAMGRCFRARARCTAPRNRRPRGLRRWW
jgi:hypothetical protein